MGGFDLPGFIQEQKRRGYTDEQITSYLLQYGYEQKQIDKALGKRFSFFKKKPVNMQLVAYFKQNLARGYDAQAIKSFLKESNYDDPAINEAAKYALKNHVVNHVHDISIRTFAMFAGLFLMLGAVMLGAYYMIGVHEPEKLLDYELSITQYEIEPGETLYFTNSFINLGKKIKYDIYLDYKVTSVTSGNVLVEKGETIGVATIDTTAREIEIPKSALPGRYRFEGVARYGNDIAVSYVNFNIIRPEEEPTCGDGIMNQDETDVDCGGSCGPCIIAESCFDGKRNQDETGVDCGGVCRPCVVEASCFDGKKNQDETGVDCGGICKVCDGQIIKPDNKEIIAKVESLGTYNEAESLRLCNTIDNLRIKDDCFLMLSKSFNSSLYCSEITSDSIGNVCYMNFVQQGDYSVCDKIQDVYIRRSCESLKQIQAIIGNETLGSTS